MAAFSINFKRPLTGGSIFRVKYSESFEKEPETPACVRRKGDRCDTSKTLFGTQDIYRFQGLLSVTSTQYYSNGHKIEFFMPFHFRTLRFISVDIEVTSSGLILDSFQILEVNCPLAVYASFEATQELQSLRLQKTTSENLIPRP